MRTTQQEPRAPLSGGAGRGTEVHRGFAVRTRWCPNGSPWTRRAGKALIAAALALLLGPMASVPVTAQVSTEGDRVGPEASRGDTVTISLAEAEERALAQNPTLQAARRQEGIAEGELSQAETYRYNPRVEFELETLDPGPGSDVFDRYEGLVVQELEWAGQWGLRKSAASHGVTQASAAARDAERRTLLEVREAYWAAAAARRRAEVATEIASLVERLREAVRTQFEEGAVSALDANLAEIEHGRSRARMLTAERERESATLELKRVIGLSPEAPLRVEDISGAGDPSTNPAASDALPASPELPDPASLGVDSLTEAALQRRPDLQSAGADVEQTRELERLARREAIPNLRLLAPVRRRGPGGAADIGVGVGLSVPLWNRNGGTADARQAAHLRSRDRRDAVELRVRAEVRDAVQAYRRAFEEQRVLASSVLGPAGNNLELLEESYRAGKIDLASLLLLQNQLLDAQLEYWDAWLAQRRAWARLRAAVGRTPSETTGDES